MFVIPITQLGLGQMLLWGSKGDNLFERTVFVNCFNGPSGALLTVIIFVYSC